CGRPHQFGTSGRWSWFRRYRTGEGPWPGASPDMAPRRSGVGRRSARFAVDGVRAAARAELLQLEPVRVVAPVLLRDVVALLALPAGHAWFGADIVALASHQAVS